MLRALLERDVDDRRAGRAFAQALDEQGTAGGGCRRRGEQREVRPVEPRHDRVLGGDPEGGADVLHHRGRGRGGQREDALGANFPRDAGEAQVVGPEVVPPLRDAVGLVDREEGDPRLAQQVEEALVVEPLRRDVEQLEAPVDDPRGDRALLLRADGRVEPPRRDAEARQEVDLVLHQRDERRHDDRRPLERHGGQLVTERFARARREDRERTVPGEERVDDRAQPLAERREAEGGAQDLFGLLHGRERSRPWARRVARVFLGKFVGLTPGSCGPPTGGHTPSQARRIPLGTSLAMSPGMLRSSLSSSIFAAACLAALSACAPTTTYRYSAFVPAVRPIPWDGQTPQQPGTVSLEGSLTSTTVQPNLSPQVGDTAVQLPQWTAEGSVMVAASSRVQIGLRAAYASYAWSQESATGTMPVPNAPPSWGIGPEVHAAFPLDRDHYFWLGIAGNVMSYQVPYAEWTLDGATNSPSCGALPCSGSYTLTNTSSEPHLVYSLGLYPSFNIGRDGRYGHVVALVSATNGFSNDGFTNVQSNGSTVSSVGPIVIVGGGYGIRYEWLHASALLYEPLTSGSSPVDYGPGVQLTFGVDFDTRAD